MATIATLAVSLTARTAAFGRGMKSARGQVVGFAASVQRLRVSLLRIGSVLAGVAGIAGLGALVRDAKNGADQIGKLARKIGVSSAALSGLAFAADLSDISLQTFTQAISQQSKRLSEAVGGSKRLRDAFARLRLDPRKLLGASPDQAFLAIARAIAQIQNPAERTRAAFEVWGRSGTELLKLLDVTGVSGLEDMLREAQSLGLVLDEQLTAKAERLNDSFTRLGAVARRVALTFVDEFGAQIAAAIEKAAVKLAAFIKSAPAFYQGVRDFAHKVADDVRAAGDALAPFYDAMIRGWTLVGDALGRFAPSLDKIKSSLIPLLQVIERTFALIGRAIGAAGAIGAGAARGVTGGLGALATLATGGGMTAAAAQAREARGTLSATGATAVDALSDLRASAGAWAESARKVVEALSGGRDETVRTNELLVVTNETLGRIYTNLRPEALRGAIAQ